MYLLDKINEPDKTVFIDGSEGSYTGHMVSGQVRKDKLDCSKELKNLDKHYKVLSKRFDLLMKIFPTSLC